jgi:predicted Fe-Mo cluster-binding NifX family protein
MRIAITARGVDLDSGFEARFGRAPFVLVGESDSDTFEAVENEGSSQSGGAGVAAGQLLADRGVQALVTGRVGPNASRVLQAAGIEVYTLSANTVREALLALRQQLQTVTEPTSTDRPVGEATLAVATDGDKVADHFGHCREFTFAAIKNGAIVGRRVLPNPGHQPDFLPGYLAERGVTAIVAGGMGPRAVEHFQARGIEVILGACGRVSEVLEDFRDGRLASGESKCTHS